MSNVIESVSATQPVAAASEPAFDPNNPEGVMDINQFAKRVRVSKSRLYELMKDGTVPHLQPGGPGCRVLFLPRHIKEFFDIHEVRPNGRNIVRRRRFGR